MTDFKPAYMKRWRNQTNYVGQDFSDYFIAAMRLAQSGSIEKSNFKYIEKRTRGGATDIEQKLVIKPRFDDHAFGWRRYLLIHHTVTRALRIADMLNARTAAQEVLDPEGERRILSRTLRTSWQQASEVSRQELCAEAGIDESWAESPTFPYKAVGVDQLIEILRRD